MTPSRGIGRDGTIPDDMRHFRSLTIGQTVLMGRKTWDSLPAKKRPLSRSTHGNMDHALALYPDLVDTMLLEEEGCDVFFPEIRHRVPRGPTHEFVCYVRRGGSTTTTRRWGSFILDYFGPNNAMHTITTTVHVPVPTQRVYLIREPSGQRGSLKMLRESFFFLLKAFSWHPR